jgi:hypothetical protein
MRALRTASAVLACTSVALVALAATGAPSGADAPIARSDLAEVRQATTQFHDVAAATQAGYDLLDVCFDDAQGGMGIHYLKGVDADLDPLAPEALVYEVTKQGPKLVAVEYIVPMSLSNNAPTVLGQPLHANPDLGLWVLHAWIWKGNPAGVFADFNPNVRDCP